MHQFSFSKKRKLKQNITDFLEVNWLKKQYKKSNTKFIAISEDTAKYFKDKLPSKIIKNIFVLPNATNTKVYKSEFTEKTDQFKLISIGNLVPKKNHQMLIDVIFYLKNNFSRVHALKSFPFLGLSVRNSEYRSTRSNL